MDIEIRIKVGKVTVNNGLIRWDNVLFARHEISLTSNYTPANLVGFQNETAKCASDMVREAVLAYFINNTQK